ncbi:hypothetical protein [Budvicia aquatica]|uniref:hypothetical protein n=1 Tax=Budvicia aquatica TaxID=82979 RepID=UPI002086F161|nr:hypothetical protein [Budvicia aquatica]GKX52737.1 hypothetical protein SOASR029_30460 [Budvicia aquatica]
MNSPISIDKTKNSSDRSVKKEMKTKRYYTMGYWLKAFGYVTGKLMVISIELDRMVIELQSE